MIDLNQYEIVYSPNKYRETEGTLRNVNKMGSSMESVQNAYMGFSKQQYQLLDNLKLGFGGTKGEMERLLEEAEKLTGIHYDISNLGDVYSAIHAIQNDMMISGYTVEELSQKLTDMSLSQTEVTRVAQQMGITYEDALARMQAGTLTVQDAQILLGTTAKEAGSTIEGSMGSLSAAWENLVVGFARSDSDLDTLINNVVSSAEGAFKNLLPIAEKALTGIGDFVEKLAPIIATEIPKMIKDIAPSMLKAGAAFLTSLSKGIKDNIDVLLQGLMPVFNILIQAITDNAPLIFEIAMTLLTAFLTAINENMQLIIDGTLQILNVILNAIITNLPLIMEMGLQLIIGLAQGISQAIPDLMPTIIDVMLGIVDMLIDNVDELIVAALSIIMALTDGILKSLPKLIDRLPEIIGSIVSALTAPDMITQIAIAGTMLFTALLIEMPHILHTIGASIPDIIDAIIKALQDNFPEMIRQGSELFSQLFKNFPQFLDNTKKKGAEIGIKLLNGLNRLGDRMRGIFSDAWKVVKESFPNVMQWGKDIVTGLWNGINSMSNWITEKIKGFNEDVLNGIKEFFGIHSPSTVMRDKIGKNLSLGLAEGIDDNSKNVLNSANTLSQDISNALDTTYRMNAISGSISQESSGNIQTIASVADIPKVLNNQNIAANGGNMTIILELDKQQFAKAVYKYNNSETQRVGLKLAKGV